MRALVSVLLACLLAVVILLSFLLVAQAASPVTGRYATGDRVRAVYFDPSVPSKWRGAIGKAAASWDSLPNVTRFDVQPGTRALSSNPCDGQLGGILRGPVAGAGVLAENRSCQATATGQLLGFRQTYNSKVKFYPGTGKVPKKKYDLQSVATHELGHSEGWTGDHYGSRNGSGLCGNKKKQATMCPAIYTGTKRLRSLQPDDSQPVAQSYAQPPIAAASAVAPGGAGARGCLGGLARRIRGGKGADIDFGRSEDDCVVGGFGSDDLRTAGGNDTIIAGPGDDVIVPGPGNDLVLAGLGADQIYARDGSFDRIRCGRDSAPDSVFTADSFDRLVNCERPPSTFAAIPLPPAYD